MCTPQLRGRVKSPALQHRIMEEERQEGPSRNRNGDGSRRSSADRNRKRSRPQQQQQQPQRSPSGATHGQFMDDEFRTYMHRKIELQRKQFGLVLPPPPSPSQSPTIRTGTTTPQSKTPTRAPTSASRSSTTSSSRKRVRFPQEEDEEDQSQHSQQSPSQSSPPSVESITKRSTGRKRRGRSSAGGSGSNNINEGLSGVLSRLKEKHGESNNGRTERDISTSNSGKKRPKSSRKRRRGEIKQDNNDHNSNQSSPLNVNVTVNQTTQDQSPAATSVTRRNRPDLFFLGVVVLINGYTSPDTPTLTRMLQKHGGDIEKYETSRVTHIIASALSTAKALIYKRQRNPTPYVKPEWIVDSCNAKTLLPYAEYLIDEIKDDSVGTKTVKSFFASTNATDKGSKSLIDASRQINSPTRRSPSTKWKSSNDTANEIRERSPSTGKDSLIIKEASRPNVGDFPVRASNVTRTVGTDPTFLDSYFKNSRLSFIGSFKQRMKSVARGDASASSPTRQRRQSTSQDERFVFHIDIDCFFAAVALRKYPQYRNRPVAIGHGWKTDAQGRPIPVGDGSHSNQQGKKSYSELSTCNYKAREYGVRKGMFLHQAKQLCKDLIVLPYDYDGYEEVSESVVDILYRYAERFQGTVEQISCDEAYVEIHLSPQDMLDGRGSLLDVVKTIAEDIRRDVYAATDCTASVGVGANKFLAKLATDKAKPDGSFVVRDCYELLSGLNLRDLPGIGWKLDRKLKANNLETVKDVLALGDEAEDKVCSLLGTGNGQKLLSYIDGKDDRPVQAARRKTIGAECNYGVRFDGIYGPDYMLDGLSKEITKRMEGIGVLGGQKLTLKIMQRKEGANNPAKFLGHGSCHSHSKTCDLPGVAGDWESISKTAMKLFKELAIDKDDIRGMGIVLSKLTFKDDNNKGTDAPNISLWLQGSTGRQDEKEVVPEATSPSSEMPLHCVDDGGKSATKDGNFTSSHKPFFEHQSGGVSPYTSRSITEKRSPESTSNQSRTNDEDYYQVPSLSQIDHDVVEHLPEDIQETVRRKMASSALGGSSMRKANSDANEKCEASGAKTSIEIDLELSPRSDSSDQEPVDDGELALPPLSQIDRDEVMALPSPLREEILNRIEKQMTRSVSSPVRMRSPPAKARVGEQAAADSSAIEGHHYQQMNVEKQMTRSVSSPVRMRSPPAKARVGEQAAADSSAIEGHHYQQMNVKRMMKLASVKSGNTDSISLTQLEKLPLEIQLQIANNDEAPLGRRRKEPPSVSSPIRDRLSPARQKPKAIFESRRTKRLPASIIDSKSSEPDLADVVPIHFEKYAIEDPYESGILPLTNWMNTHPDPSPDDVSYVKQFFFALLSEKRADEVLVLLRVIKRRDDEWGKAHASTLLDAVDDRYIYTEGRRLDRMNL